MWLQQPGIDRVHPIPRNVDCMQRSRRKDRMHDWQVLVTEFGLGLGLLVCRPRSRHGRHLGLLGLGLGLLGLGDTTGGRVVLELSSTLFATLAGQ